MDLCSLTNPTDTVHTISLRRITLINNIKLLTLSISLPKMLAPTILDSCMNQ